MTIEIDLASVPGAPSGSRALRGYVSTPAGVGPWPAVVVPHEAFSVDDVMRRHAAVEAWDAIEAFLARHLRP